jgi:hypothetical protein
MGEWRIDLTGQFIEWVPQMPCDVQAFWIETFAQVELKEAGVDTSIPGHP